MPNRTSAPFCCDFDMIVMVMVMMVMMVMVMIVMVPFRTDNKVLGWFAESIRSGVEEQLAAAIDGGLGEPWPFLVTPGLLYNDKNNVMVDKNSLLRPQASSPESSAH